MSSTTYARRKAQGVCVWCTHPVTDGHVYCQSCLDIINARYTSTATLRYVRQTHDEHTCAQCQAVTAAEAQTRLRRQDWWDMGTGQPVRERARA